MDDRIGPIAGPERTRTRTCCTDCAFVRIKGHDGCPPRLVWSVPSDPFRIAAWYDPGDAPPTQIALPDITRASVKSIKPNVAFKVPASLNNLLNRNSPKDFLDNKGKDGGGLGLGWICGFCIPMITFCAFIVLNIFLSLFNIVFGWLLFLKICLPFPRRTDG